MGLKDKITEEMKTSLRSGEKEKLSAIRMILAKIKQIEIDTRTVLDDDAIIDILSSSIKKSRDAIAQFEKGGREDLVQKETFDLSVAQSFLPEALSEEEIVSIVNEAISEVQAIGIKDMGKVMKVIVPKTKGRADSGKVSAMVKQKLFTGVDNNE